MGSIKLMIVDDDEGHRCILKRLLEKRGGYEVVEAGSGQECLEKIETERPTLILMDIIMPGMDGWEVCKKIKTSDSIRSTMVVMLSSKNDRQDRLKSKYSHADMHLHKALRFDDILKMIKKATVTVTQ